MLPPPLQSLVATVQEALAGADGLRALLLNGSHVTGLGTPASDVDLTILVTDEAARDAMLARLGETFAFQGYRHEVPHYRQGDTLLAVCAYPQAWTDDWVARAFRSADDLREWQGWLQHKVIDAVAIHDPESILRRYREQLAHYPRDLAAQVATEALDYLETEYLGDPPFRSGFHYAYSLRDLLEHLGLALYALNRRFYAPPLKQWPRDLRTLRPDVEDELQQLLSVLPEEPLAGKQRVLAVLVPKLRAEL